MTASGPMAQGPTGAARAFGPKAQYGGGIAVMNGARPGGSGSGGASGSGGGRGGQWDDSPMDPDASDLDEEDDEDVGFKIRARELNDIGDEDEMAPLVLPRDPKVVRSATERKKERAEIRIKLETPYIKPEPEDGASTPALSISSTNATPALDTDSKTGTIDSKDFQIIEDFKPDIKEDFDVTDPGRERLYIFQFPRKFPELVDPSLVDSGDLEADVKPEGGADEAGNAIPRKKDPPDWGRAGPRPNKGARWPTLEGQIGELCIHKSGRVSMMINNDLHYEVLPAAQPSFLQEIVILDHDPAQEPVPLGGARKDSEPNRAMLMMGQTSKKFIVVPEVEHLLERVALQEKEEREDEKRRLEAARLLKKEQR
ncbi:hypothetical protein RQP46_003556 [Phenoliferia psychrophenolica]